MYKVRCDSERNSGVLLVDKPAGLSSAAVVARVKRAFGAKRVGHAGTLDPDATGLLIILLNGATRVASYAADGFKVYSGELELGVTTTSDDLSGDVLSRSEVVPSASEVLAARDMLVGRISQVPPKVSAKKLDGKRAYKLLLQGESFELAPREVEVRRFELEPTGDSRRFWYRVEVSPGTYVRALARDLGESLGCGGAVVSIRRERSGHFSVEDGIELERVAQGQIRDWGDLVPGMPRLSVPVDLALALLNGQRWALEQAWSLWLQGASAVEGEAHLVLYECSELGGSLGILRREANDGFSFEINVARLV
ncbi:MAG: tRNA pseudouridine(55) synthase TruB [Pseudomonadota bacterium]|jgi:tRNA pseudouridine55 synthase